MDIGILNKSKDIFKTGILYQFILVCDIFMCSYFFSSVILKKYGDESKKWCKIIIVLTKYYKLLLQSVNITIFLIKINSCLIFFRN